MREIELKLLLTEDQEKRLRQCQAVRDLADGPARTQVLRSIYYDTPDHALRKAGIALRLRRSGRQWIQTVKKATTRMAQGLSQPIEDECLVRGQNLTLSLIADDDLREEVLGLSRDGLAPVVETRFRRTARMLHLGQAQVELAIDKGDVVADSASAPLLEAELELKSGTPGDLYHLAGRIFDRGPIRFSDCSKSERALRLLSGEPETDPALRKAQPVVLTQDMTVERAAHTILTEGLGHALPNVSRVIDSDDPGGPHQLRVGLRRLRSTLSAFRPVLGRAAVAPWGDAARTIAAQAGALRDMDVLAADLVDPLAARHPDEAGFARLQAAIHAKRLDTQSRVRAYLETPEVTAFGFGFAGFLAARGWLDPADHTQTLTLAQPIRPFAQAALSKRWKAVVAYGRRIGDLTIDERHEMRKEIKKLRYLVDQFRSLFDADAVADFTTHVKKLQKAFGALNDAAMAEILLMADDAPGGDDPVAARASGRIIGLLQARSDQLWPQAMQDWTALYAFGPFWKRKR